MKNMIIFGPNLCIIKKWQLLLVYVVSTLRLFSPLRQITKSLHQVDVEARNTVQSNLQHSVRVGDVTEIFHRGINNVILQ